jgi:hypothetical protein
MEDPLRDKRRSIKFKKERIAHLRSQIEISEDQIGILEHEIKELEEK